MLNFNNKLPDFDFTLNIADANLYKLNFDKLDTSSTVKMLLTANFKGNNIDNLDGEIKLLNSKFRKFNNNLELYNFSIKTYKENTKPALSLRTDFIDADIKGYYNFAGLSEMVGSTLESLMPSQFIARGKKKGPNKNMFTFDINFKNTDKINDFFKTGISIADKSYIKGIVFPDSIINITGKTDLLTIKNIVFKDFSFNAAVSGSKLSLGISSPSLTLLEQSELKDFSVSLKTIPDNFIFKVNWDNKDTVLNRGNFTARGTVIKSTAGKRYATLEVDIDSSDFYSENSLWKLSNSTVLIDSNAIKINRLYLSNQQRYYVVDGAVSSDPKDTLHLEFKGIDIAPLNYWLERTRNDPDDIPLDFKGRLDGKISLTNVYRNLLLFGNIVVNKFSILGSEFGNISINSALDNEKKLVNISAANNINSVKTFDITGIYDPVAKKIDLNANTVKLPIGFLNPLLKVFASDISGFASGKLRLSGETENLFLTGAAMVDNASLKISYLQTKYSMHDSIRFDRQGIKFNDVKIKDIEGNVATVSGAVYHKSFKDFSADLIINIAAKGFQVLNTQSKDNPMFYGLVYASGVAKIKSDQNLLSFDISAKTSKSTKTGKTSELMVPISKGLSVSEYSFISFADSSKDKQNNTSVATPSSSSKEAAMDLIMNLEVTPDAEIQIIFDSKAGDIMKGHGSSPNLNVTLNEKGDFGISGDYIIESGTYNFTLGPIINKPFDVENGGRIMFNGDLKDAEIDLKASYLHLKASLASILGDEYPERVRVEPQLNLSGKLFNPAVGFDIYLPDADEATRTKLRNLIATPEEITRQVTALLLIQNFIASGNANVSTTATSAMEATSMEMISNRVSNMLSQISRNVDIGINFRPGMNAMTTPEAELALSTQVLNNKVVLNGNFDVRGTNATAAQLSSNTNQLTGDFNAEIKLSEKMRFKVFNRYNDTYIGSGLSPYTQGVGIFYNRDFNKFSDLFRKKPKADMKKEDETKPKEK